MTLLELIIAISLMAVLSITTTQMLRKTTVQTKKLTSGIDNINHLRAAMNIMKNDAAKAVNFRDLNLFMYNEAQKEREARYEGRVKEWIEKHNKEKKPTPLATAQNLTEAQKSQMIEDGVVKPVIKKPEVEVIYTHFVGDKEKMYFTTSSGVRFRSADKISDLAEVGYFLRTCKSRRAKKSESKCLWRSVSYNLDDDVTKGGKESVLIENVESAKFTYLSFSAEDIKKDDADWIESWDSRVQSDQKTGDSFPAAISLSLEVRIPDKKIKDKDKLKTERLTGVFPIDFANNKPFEKIKSTDPAPTDPVAPLTTPPPGTSGS